jgi:DNA repair protein RadC
VEAAVEIGRRLARAEVPRHDPMSDPAHLAAYLALRHARRDQEVVGAVYLDGAGRWLAEEVLVLGTLHRTRFEPRQVLAHALALAEEATDGAGPVGIVLFHTHPSGDPTPSPEDETYTHLLATACQAVGVTLVDHLVLGSPRRWVSMLRGEG